MASGTAHELTPRQARRIAVRAQLLAAGRPTDVLDVVRHLGFLQVDLTRVVAEHADLALWTRLGGSYDPEDLEELVGDGALVEHKAHLRPSEDIALFAADMALWPGEPPLKEWQEDVRDWVAANDGCRRDVLALLRAEGPTAARDIPDTCDVPWRSSGWTNDKNVMKLLECMESRGEVAVASREGRERRWDLAERIHPGDTPVPVAEAHLELAARRLRALGIARPRALEAWEEKHDVRGVGEPARIEGVRGVWRVDPAYLDGPASTTTSRGGPRSCRRSTGWSSTASGWRTSSASTTSWRCTSRWRSGSGATGRCPSSTATSWWARSTPPPTARAAY